MEELITALQNLELDKNEANNAITQIQEEIHQLQLAQKAITTPGELLANLDTIDALTAKAQPFIEVADGRAEHSASHLADILTATQSPRAPKDPPPPPPAS